ncbi:lectin BRA-3-like [Mytilus trossulus]|uniref:lectin BRA-3-like n=1 Tax=Mytilus trossulus TaxID=6551 RepID=UPI003004BF0E
MMAIGMLIMPNSVTSRASVEPIPIAARLDVRTTVPATVQSFLATQAAAQTTAPAPAQTTPCIPTICPADYLLLADQTASPNCYFYSGNTQKIWSDALKVCTLTPGAYLWRPNTRAEADAVKTTFAIGNDVHIWTGANSPTHDENFVFAVDNAALSLLDLPFGILDSSGDIGDDCVDIEFDTGDLDWEWENDDCDDDERYICELPRKTCP